MVNDDVVKIATIQKDELSWQSILREFLHQQSLQHKFFIINEIAVIANTIWNRE